MLAWQVDQCITRARRSQRLSQPCERGARGLASCVAQAETMLSSFGSWAVIVLSSLGSVLGSWVAAASTGAIAAWVLNFVRDRWSRPRLKVVIDLRRGSVVEDHTTDGARTKYARLVVQN